MPTKTSTKLTAAFEAFLGSPKAARFRQSDVAEILYPLTRPRDHTVARDEAARMIQAAAKAGRVERTGHLHWQIRPVDVTRTLRDGRKVAEVAGLKQLTLNTRCPGKWAAVDLETGEIYEGSPDGWVRASTAATAGVRSTPAPAGVRRPLYYHPQASHVTPDHRDGWNAALKAAGVPPSTEWR